MARPQMTRQAFASKIRLNMSETRLLRAILAAFVLVGASYALVTPVFEASDELWHFPMVRHLADGNPLPVQVFDPDLAGPWKQEASQPPLYYYLGAALTFWVDTGDMAQVRWLNPHVDNGVITADGNINLAIHDPALNPWRGTLLAVRLVRLLSVLLGAGTVYLTYLIAREVAPGRPDVALGAAAANAFLPMFLFISGAVNNDNLAIPLASLGILLLIRAVNEGGRRPDVAAMAPAPRLPLLATRWPAWLAIGAVMGLAILTKQGTFALLPLAWGTALIASWRTSRRQTGQARWSQLGRAFLESWLLFGVVMLPIVLIAGWWYWRNIRLYGDFLGWNAFIAVLGARAQPATLAQLWDERRGFMMAFWGLFGGVNVPMAGWTYGLLNGALLAAVPGFLLALARRSRRSANRTPRRRRRRPLALLTFLLDGVAAHFALVVCLLFALAVIIGLVQWATTTWSSQGRLVFTALSPLSVLFVYGLVGWMPARWGRVAAGILAGFMLLLAAAAPWLWIRPAYLPESYRPPGVPLNPVDVQFGRLMRLTGYGLRVVGDDAGTVRPGGAVDVVLSWEVLAAADRDWSVFVHLTDPVLGAPIAQRDMYHGQGLRPTRLLTPGQTMRTYYRLAVPSTAVSPADLQLVVGLYDFESGQRLATLNGQEATVLDQLSLQPAPGDVPNPTDVNFMNAVRLVGYQLSPRRAAPGEVVRLQLHVQAMAPLAEDYTFFAQVVNLTDTTRWASQDLGLPTSSWQPGKTQVVELALPLAADTPPRVYPVILGLYTRTADGGFHRLQLVTPDGRITQEDFLRLSQIRVD